MTNTFNDPKTAQKTYWILLNRLLYNNIFPTTPHLLVVGKFISHFRTKANLINNFFALICTPIKNTSAIPSHAQ